MLARTDGGDAMVNDDDDRGDYGDGDHDGDDDDDIVMLCSS